MEDALLYDKLVELFGGEKFSGDEQPGDKWSPNLYSKVYFLDSGIMTETHLGGRDAVTVAAEDVQQGDIIPTIQAVLDLRKLNAIEGIYCSNGWGGTDIARGIAELLSRTGRVSEYGGVDNTDEGIAITSKNRVPNASENSHRNVLQPEHYPMDAEGGKLWTALMGNSTTVKDDDEDLVIDYYSDSVTGTINHILTEYNKIFASGYEVLTPAGILTENSKGYGVLTHIDGGTSVKDKVERNLQHLYAALKERMGIVEVHARSLSEISRVIVNRVDSKGRSYEGNLYFPYKLLEYAYGQKHVAGNDSGSLTTYEGHSNRDSWEDYAKSEVRDSLKEAILRTIYIALANDNLQGEPESPRANARAAEVMNAFTKAFLTCILVSRFDKTNGNIVSLKVRILSEDFSDGGENILLSVLNKSHGTLDGSKGLQVYRPIHSGYFHEYFVELNTKLANAEPKFAYHALEAVKRAGGELNYSNCIFGLDSNDRILKNGGVIDLQKKLSHLVVAGSRAGKGVWTFSILAASVLSKRPVFYLDNKPDMASLFLKYGPSGFALNGSNITYDPENGTDYFGQFTNVDSWIRHDRVPEYVADVFGGRTYRDLGAAIYLRALTMMTGILAARADAPQHVDRLGGPEGIVLVVDEVANANANLMGLLGKGRSRMAAESYANKLREANESDSKAKIDADKPNEGDYWFTQFYKDMQTSLEELYRLSNAGLKNVESSKSDIFMLTQEPPEMITSLGEVSDLFVRANKNSKGTSKAIDNPKILPSFGLLGGVDVFAGYDRDNRAFLAQGNKASKASQWLNEINRGFGYLKSYNPEVRDKFNTVPLAEKAVYYKPFLLFADGKQDSYFVRNSLEYMKESGVDADVVISRNSVPGDETRINPAVGFMGYLEKAGMGESEVTSVLNKSGEIAQYVTNMMGYPGTWRELLLDFRPEWMFSVADILAALKEGTSLLDSNKKKHKDFLYVYPEAFSEISVSAEYSEGMGIDSDEFSSLDRFVDQDGSDRDDAYESEGIADVEGFGDANYRVAEPGKGTGINGFNVYDGMVGAEDLNVVHSDEEVPTGNLAEDSSGAYEGRVPENAGVSAWSNGPGMEGTPQRQEWDNRIGEFYNRRSNIPPIDISEAVTEDLSLENQEFIPDWTDDPKGAIEFIVEKVMRGLLHPTTGRAQYGAGHYTQPNGTVDNYNISRRSVQHIGNSLAPMPGPEGIAQCMKEITAGALTMVGGLERLRSLRVIDGMLIVNNTAYRPKFPQEYYGALPHDIRAEVKTGNVSRLFDWSVLRSGAEVQRLSFDDPAFISDYVSPALGWGGRISVEDYFRFLKSLQNLTIAGTVFTRQNYKNEIRNSGEYYQPVIMRQYADATARWMGTGRKKSWGFVKNTWSAKDISGGRKALGISAGLVGAGVSGTGEVAAKAGRFLGKIGSTAFEAIRRGY